MTFKCPECHKELDFLCYERIEQGSYNFDEDESIFDGNYEPEDVLEDSETFSCPECGAEVILDDFED